MKKIKVFNPETKLNIKVETYEIWYNKYLVRYNKRLNCPNDHNYPYAVIIKDNKIICEKCDLEVYTIATKERIKKFKALDKWLIENKDNLNKPLNQWENN